MALRAQKTEHFLNVVWLTSFKHLKAKTENIKKIEIDAREDKEY